MHKVINIIAAIATLGLGIAIFYNLAPLLLDGATLKSVLVVLPSRFTGLTPTIKIALFAGLIGVGLASLVWAGLSIIRFKSTAMKRLNLILLFQVVLIAVMLEAAIRTGIAYDVKPVSTLTNYVNPNCGEDYYWLSASPQAASSTNTYDPELGWRPRPKPGNPKGLPWPIVMDERPKTWFFGDSFIAGVVAPENSIPARFEVETRERQALNYGVSGFGLDQIWLRYRQESRNIPAGAPVFIGILSNDLDRSVLSYFYALKPVFRRTADGYQLVPPPAEKDIPAALENTPAPLWSYAVALLRSVAELAATGFDRSEVNCNAAEKRAVNAYLIDAIITEAKLRGHVLRWILFDSFAAFYKPANWRYDFMKESLDRRGQIYLDTLNVLSCAAQKANTPPETFFIRVGGHLETDGNRVIARALAAMVARKGDGIAEGGSVFKMCKKDGA